MLLAVERLLRRTEEEPSPPQLLQDGLFVDAATTCSLSWPMSDRFFEKGKLAAFPHFKIGG